MNNYYDEETGEVMNLKALKEREFKLSKLDYVPEIDIPSLVNRAALEERKALVYEGKWHRFGWMDMGLMADMEPVDIKGIGLVSSYVVYNNYAVINLEKLGERLGIKRRMVLRILQNLQRKGMIRGMDIKMEKEEDRLVMVHPFYEFVGTSPIREEALKYWLKGQFKEYKQNNYS